MYAGFELLTNGACAFCHRQDVPVLAGANPSVVVGICEPCSRISDWLFRDMKDAELAGAPFPTVPGAALVVIVRDRLVDGHPDTACPRDVLMVERKDEPGKFGLPGGKLERGETSVDAAVRETSEETTVVLWPTALELLYSGFSGRGRMVDTFLVRAHGGDPTSVEGEGNVAWKPWPPSQHVGVLKGYYRGLENSFDVRLALHKANQVEPPLCQHLEKSAMTFVLEGLGPKRDTPEARKHMEAMSYVMSEEEKQAAKVVLRDVRAPKLPDPMEATPSPVDDDDSEEEGLSFNNDEREGPK
jgi:ADP-ribose pyrophosphatase YjhB (NUDIX family)